MTGTDGINTPTPPSKPTASRKFAQKYRPRIFEEVRGQPHPVRFLSGLIKLGQEARPILLHGAIGSGKTSLARIYARALNCLKPTSAGSPCLRCEHCLSGAGFHEYNTSGWGGKLKEIEEWVSPRDETPPPRDHRCNFLFFDEAQALDPRAADYLLKTVEEPKPGVTFCFATTEYGQIRPALRSRLLAFEIKPLSAENARALLVHCANAEGIKYEPGSLELLAGLRQGYARDLVTGLELVSDLQTGPITVARVREVFDVDHTQQLLAYAQSLAEGDPAVQQQAWFDWHETAGTKIAWLQAFLTSLYYNDVLGQGLIVDALIASILAPDRRPILDAFRQRLGLPELTDLAPYWRAMMAFWAMPSDAFSETALQLQIVLFHEFVNNELSKLVLETEWGARSDARSARQSGAVIRVSPVNDESGTAVPSPYNENRCPTIADAHGIIESASYLMQEHGVLFNAHILIRPELLGIDEEAPAIALIAEFCEALQIEVASWSTGPFARLSLLERDIGAGGRVQGRVLVHLPNPDKFHRDVDAATRIRSWSLVWPRDPCFRRPDAVVVRSQLGGKSRPLSFHWDSVLDLCAGLKVEERDYRPATDREEPLLDLLEIPKARRRRIAPVRAHLVNRSEILAPAAVANACKNGMPLLSALAAHQWQLLRQGWELSEHEERQRTKAKRQAALDTIHRDFGETAEAQFQRDHLMTGWTQRPEDRERLTWRGWWLPAKV